MNSIYNWIVGTDTFNRLIPAGSYYVRICLSGLTTSCATSASPFTIASAVNNIQNNSSYTPLNCPLGYTCTIPSTSGVNSSNLLQVCPESEIIPYSSSGANTSGAYYMLNNQKHQLSEFDQNWVTSHCSVPQYETTQ